MTLQHIKQELSQFKSIKITGKVILFTLLFALAAILLSVAGAFLYHETADNIQALKAYKEGVTQPTNVNNRKYGIVIIDPGHGGEDSGARSTNGILEKEINLKIAGYLYSMLKMADVDVCMTRSDDRLLYYEGQEKRKKYNDVRNRVKIASQYDDGIFVSIHQNHFPQAQYRGFQVYYSKKNPDSELLARVMQSTVKKYIQPENKRLVRSAGREIHVLDNLEMPAVLAECGFLSNSGEAQILNSDEYQRKMAFSLFVSIMQFLYS